MSSSLLPNPFVGPRAIQTGERIYGRDREAGILSNLLIAERIVLLYSPSGAGKSSLVQAALIPRLAARGFLIHPIIRLNVLPPEDLPHGDNAGYNRYIYSVKSSLEEARLPSARLSHETLASLRLPEYLDRPFVNELQLGDAESQSASIPGLSPPAAQPARYPPADFKPSDLYLFDQFEEVLTLDLVDEPAKVEFFVQLGEALANRDRWALFVIREDYLGALEPYQIYLPTRLKTTFRLDLLEGQAAREAIQNTARQGSIEFTSLAADRLVDDLRRIKVQRPDGTWAEQPGRYVEPVQLQVVCYRLWESLPPGTQAITESHLEGVGDVDQSLAAYYAVRVATVAQELGIPERLIRAWFQDHLITGSGIRGLVLMEQEKSAGLDNRAIGRFVDAHLVRAEKRAGAVWFELAHDRLIGPVGVDNVAWFDAHLSLLQRQAALWARQDRPDHLLLRETDLKEALGWARDHPQELTPVEEEFLEACREAQAYLDQARSLEAERQRSEERARAAVKLRRLLAAAVFAALIAVILAVLASLSYREATAQKEAAETAQAKAFEENIKVEIARGQALEQERIAVEARVTADAARETAEADRQAAVEARSTAQAYAVLTQLQADQQIRLSDSRKLAAQALGVQADQPDLSALLAIEAYQISDTWEAKSVLLANIQRGLEQSPVTSRPPKRDREDLVAVAMSGDGERLAYATVKGEVVIWNYQQYRDEYRLPLSGRVKSLAFSPDGNTLAAAVQRNLFLIDVQSGQVSNPLPHISLISGLSFDPSGNQLAVADGYRISVWDVINRQVLNTVQNLDAIPINTLAWSPDGLFLATGDAKFSLQLWDPRSWAYPTYTDKESLGGTTNILAWSPDGELLASGGLEGSVVLWKKPDQDAGYVEYLDLANTETGVTSLSFSSDGSILAASLASSTRIRLWDVRDARLQPLDPIDHHIGTVSEVSFSPKKGQILLASASLDNAVVLHEISVAQPLSEGVSSGPGQVISLALKETGELSELRRQAGSLEWDGSEVASVQEVTCAALSPGGLALALGLQNNSLKLFEPASTAASLTLQALELSDEFPVLGVAFSSDGKILASAHCHPGDVDRGGQPLCASSDIRLWEVHTGTQLDVRIEAITGQVNALAFMPGNSQIAISLDLEIQIWDIDTGKPEGLPLKLHEGEITSLAYNPNGDILVSGGADQLLILWDMTSGQPIYAPLDLSSGTPFSLAFARDGSLFTGSADGVIERWDIDPQSWIERNCLLAGRNLTAEEWQKYLPEWRNARQTCPQYP